MLAVPPSLFVLGMVIADTVSFAENKPFDDVLAVGDLVCGGLVSIGGLIFLGVVFNNSSSPGDYGLFRAVGAVGLALGGYEVAHGIWSFMNNDPRSNVRTAVGVAPLPGGAMLSVGGTL